MTAIAATMPTTAATTGDGSEANRDDADADEDGCPARSRNPTRRFAGRLHRHVRRRYGRFGSR